VITILREIDVLKTIGDSTEQCCRNKPIYVITYSLGGKWVVCDVCIAIDYFRNDIKEKERIHY